MDSSYTRDFHRGNYVKFCVEYEKSNLHIYSVYLTALMLITNVIIGWKILNLSIKYLKIIFF